MFEISTLKTSASLNDCITGIKSFSPSINVTDIAVVYIDSPKIMNISIPLVLPLNISLAAKMNEVIKMSGKINILMGVLIDCPEAKLGFLK